MTVLIFGAGELGTCLGKILQRNNTVLLWDKDPGKRNTEEYLPELIAKSSAIILAVPSVALRIALEEIKTYCSAKNFFLCFTKGMEQTGALAPEIIEQTMANPYVLIAGPMIAEELNQGMPGYAMCAGDQEVYQKTLELFRDTNIHCEYTQDTKSVAWCSVLKNVYAVCMGMIDGLALPGNAKGYVLGKILEEWSTLSHGLGVDPGIVWGTSGISDFLATSFSTGSHNRATGEKIIKGEIVESEGTRSLRGLIPLLQKTNITIPPILNAINAIVSQKANPTETMQKIMQTP